MSRVSLRKFSALATILVSLALLPACEQPDWKNPEYVASKIRDGSDPVQQRMAINNVSEVPEDKRKELVPALVEVYEAGGPNQKDAMKLLVQYRDPRAKEVYLAELESDATGYAGASAMALGDAKAKDAIPKMLELLQSTDNNDLKIGILQAFNSMPSKELVKPLVEILKLDVDNHPISLHAHACDVLGAIGLEDKQALDEEALKQITLAVFFGNTRGQSLDLECGLAIQKIGEPAIPHLVSIFKGEREDVQKLMMRYDTGDAAFPQNTPKLVAAKRLSSLRAKEAVDLFIEDLKETKQAPADLQGQKAVNWRIKEGQITSETIMGLGDLGDPKAVGLLEEIVSGKYTEDAWDDITDWSVEIQLRQDAGFALNRIGDRAATATLLKMADEGVIIDLERRAAMLEEQGKPEPEVRRYQFNWMTARTFAMLSDGSDYDQYKALVDKTSKDYKDLAKKLEEFLPVLELARTCRQKGDDAAQAACYAEKLGDNKPEIREKAAWEIGRLSPEAAAPVLIENLSTDFLDTREVLTFHLYRHPKKAAIAKIDAILEDEGSKSSVEYEFDHLRLKQLRAYLVNNSKD